MGTFDSWTGTGFIHAECNNRVVGKYHNAPCYSAPHSQFHLLKKIENVVIRGMGQSSPQLHVVDTELQKILAAKVISGLDAVRALAVTLVLADHFLITDHLFRVHPALGSLGVMIFFVLSGFLITSMLLKEHRASGTISLSTFYRRRAYRIFPTFYFCWVITTIVELLEHHLDRGAAAASFFYLMDYWRAFGPPDTQSHMFISWSLAIEEKFYLLWPLLLLLLLRKRSSLIRTTAYILCGLWIYRALLYLLVGVNWNYMYYPFDTRVDALLVGCLFSLSLQSDRWRLFFCRLITRQWISVLPVLFLAVAASSPPANRPAFLLVWTAQPLMIAMMLLQAMYWGWKSWTVCRSAFVRILAHLSYALYLYHPLAGKIVYLLRIPHIGVSNAVLALVMSVASYRWIEKPFLRLRDRSSKHRASPRQAEAASRSASTTG